MKKYEIELEGITPLLMNSNRMVGKLDGTRKRAGEAVKGEPEEWRDKMYYTKEEGLNIPSLNIETCFYQAAKGIKISGKEYAGRYFNGAIFVEAANVPILVGGKKIIDVDAALKEIPNLINVDVRVACLKNGVKKSSQLRYRLSVSGWKIKFVLIDAADGLVSKEKIEETINKAGMLFGFFDWRPRFGRFMLKSIKEVS